MVRHKLFICTLCRRDAIQNKTETEKKLDEILSKKEWGASTTQMNEIARLTHDP